MSATPLVRNLHPIEHASAQGKPKEILDLALRQVGFIPTCTPTWSMRVQRGSKAS